MTAARPRVLVVEDEQSLRELVVVTLSEEFECEEAADGESALELMRANPPSLVVLDSMLPGRSGIDVLREMRGDPALHDVPVLMLSAWQSSENVDGAIGAGADSFLGKPFQIEELVSVAHELAERSR
jgi:two-component system response regulator MtrA